MIVSISLILFALLLSRVSFQSILPPSGELTFLLGLILIVSFLVGKLSLKIKIPMITGFLLTGIFLGPYLLNIITREGVKNFALINEIALSIIALSAGGELDLRELAKKIGSLSTIIFFQVFMAFIGVGLIFLLLFKYIILPPIVKESAVASLSVAFALLMGTIATAKSPSTTIAIIMETGAEGNLTDTVLAITVLKDVVIIVLFTLSMALASEIALGRGGLDISLFYELFLEIIVAILIGLFIGLLLALYYKFVNRYNLLFLIALSFLISAFYFQFHFHFLLSCMFAGAFATNFFKEIREDFHSSVKEASLPIFIIFFTITGADLNLSIFKKYWIFALLYVFIRALMTFLGTYTGAALKKESREVKHLSWLGFLGQAGLTIGFLTIIERQFPSGGGILKDIALGGIILNQIFGPIGFKWALVKAGEAREKLKVSL